MRACAFLAALRLLAEGAFQLFLRGYQLLWHVVSQFGEQLVVQFQLIAPSVFVDADDFLELLVAKV